MLKKISLLISLSLMLILYGCSNPDTEVKYVSATSTFKCDEVNRRYAFEGVRGAREILDSAYRQLDQAYTDDYDIQEYYRRHVRKVMSIEARLDEKTASACDGYPDKGVNKAATEALNNLYSQAPNDPSLATCKNYHDKDYKVSYGHADTGFYEFRLDSFIVLQTPFNDRALSAEHLYKESLFSDKIKAICKEDLGERVAVAARAGVNYVATKLYNEHLSVLQKEQEEQEAKERKERLAKYSSSLYDKGPAMCEDFTELSRLARSNDQDKDIYMEALKLTIADIPRPSKDHKRQAFEDSFENSFESTLHEIWRFCSDGRPVEQVVMNIPSISKARSPYYLRLLEVTNSHSRGGMGYCAECARAASITYRQGVDCEEGDVYEGLICFDDPLNAYDYNLLLVQIDSLESRAARLQDVINRSDDELDHESDWMVRCAAEAAMIIARGYELEGRESQACINYRNGIIEQPEKVDLANIKADIANKRELVDKLKKKASEFH